MGFIMPSDTRHFLLHHLAVHLLSPVIRRLFCLQASCLCQNREKGKRQTSTELVGPLEGKPTMPTYVSYYPSMCLLAVLIQKRSMENDILVVAVMDFSLKIFIAEGTSQKIASMCFANQSIAKQSNNLSNTALILFLSEK